MPKSNLFAYNGLPIDMFIFNCLPGISYFEIHHLRCGLPLNRRFEECGDLDMCNIAGLGPVMKYTSARDEDDFSIIVAEPVWRVQE